MKLFVYGTLKRGFGLNRYLSWSKFIGNAELNGYEMYSLGSFPAIVKGNGIIKGEIWEIDEFTLMELDVVEGAYERVIEKINNTDCFVYVMKKTQDYWEKIDKGKWD